MLANILTGLGIDEFFTRTDVPSATTRHLLPDALGSALALTDSAGTVQTEYTYEPFGRTTVTGASNSNPYQYTGRENDATGLYHYRARYYHPQVQRFISEDPIENQGVKSFVDSQPNVPHRSTSNKKLGCRDLVQAKVWNQRCDRIGRPSSCPRS
ncbi:MAG: RHS repeat-associated core domain-containing protein [Deltaproteobacteria bacterium]|nr:RHS repeat-associated core domain-containing protein [Deltaproteobacteria bacterium]